MSSAPERSISYVLTRPVSNYMSADILMLGPDTPTRDAARMLQRYERDDIIVTDEFDEPIGIVTDEDILSKVSDVRVNAETTRIRDIMSTPLITIQENATLQDALHIMRDNKIRKLPVLSRKGGVAGIILQVTIVNIIRDATATPPRLLSPPVKAILGNLGFVLQFAGALLLVPAVVATILNDTETATGIYLTTVLLLVTGFCLNSYGEKASLNMRQASILVFSSLFILILFGTIPYMYVSPFENESPVEAFANGFFSSAAGFTTGGVSIFDRPEELPQSFTFYRSFTQLVGGMSFIYLIITAFYPESKLQAMRGFISGKTLHMRELFGTITMIFAVYILIVASLLYVIGGEDLIDYVSLAMSTLATGGFVPSQEMVGNLAWEEHYVLMGAMILGALPFTFHYGFVRKRFLFSKLGKEVLVFFAILAGAALSLIVLGELDPAHGAFYAVSAGTTAGVQMDSLAAFNEAAHGILILLMFLGGCGFSTAGGVKIFRLFHVWRMILALRGGDRPGLTETERKEILTTLLILILFPVIATITATHLAAISGAAFDDAFLEATGLITTGGLSANVVTAETDPATKIVLSFLMIFGRLEILAILYIFAPRISP